MIVNIASPCGYTNFIMKGLVDLYDKYNLLGLEILGFPCMQFGSELNCEINFENYGAKEFKIPFPLFSKIYVNGKNTHELFVYLKYHSALFKTNNNKNLKDIPDNFSKFLVDNQGKVVAYYTHNVELKTIEKDIKRFLL